MGPLAVSLLMNGAKILWSRYQEVEAQNSGLTPGQLKARLDALDDVVRQNFEIIEQLDAQVRYQKFLTRIACLTAAISLCLSGYLVLVR